MEIAAVLATLVDPEETAIRIERAVEVRSDTARVVYLINPNCVIDGEVVRTSVIRKGLIEGTLEPLHAARDAMAGLINARAVVDWMRTGRRYRLAPEAGAQRTVYEEGTPDLVGSVETIGTHSLAKVAALGRLGMGLYNIVGTAQAPQYVVHRHSVGMLDAEGCPVRYDAAELILGEIHDALPIDHPFMLAYRARLNWELLQARVAKEVQLLIVTPDIVKKGAGYDPGGMHSYVAPDAPGKVWDDVERHFFG
jgi:hypothetical protein